MNLQQAYYEQKFENAFLRAKGDEFQTFFERLMGLAYKADFMACRPWGNIGDRKNDGFLKSERRLFQVYAPNEMKAKDAIDKITEDFEGAKIHWGKHFDKWVFVHNAYDGLPPQVIELLLNLKNIHPGIVFEHWNLEELQKIFRSLSEEDCISWFGFAPTEETKAKLGFKELQVVFETLASKAAPPSSTVQPVPQGKIEANALSESVRDLIKSGMSKSPLVSAFLETWYDETLGERLAVAFRNEYGRLRGTMPPMSPNEMFSELQAWAGGKERGTSEHEMAVLTVLAYYFERCDIFEEPKAVRP
ncbi:ABC-three component system protein [Candidatus Electronema sp. JC]|uniref:ABC-three component system protein n=2 Tax=unclassified Candidatus Electronema TaxID=2677064 RepID=UPI003B43A64E